MIEHSKQNFSVKNALGEIGKLSDSVPIEHFFRKSVR